jgi:Ulp1 family protease
MQKWAEIMLTSLLYRLLKTAVKIHAHTDSFDEKKIVFSNLPVVQQKNGFDCGIFLLHSVETFVKSPFSNVEQFSGNQLWKKSFKPKVKRKQLFDKITTSLAEK